MIPRFANIRVWGRSKKKRNYFGAPTQYSIAIFVEYVGRNKFVFEIACIDYAKMNRPKRFHSVV